MSTGQIVVSLRDGHSAVLRDARTVTNGERRRFLEALAAIAETPWRDLLVTDLLVALFVESWTLPLPPPREDPASLDEVCMGDMQALQAAAEHAAEVLFPNLGPSSRPDSLYEHCRRLKIRLSGGDVDGVLVIDEEILQLHRTLTLAEVLHCSVAEVENYSARQCDLALAAHAAHEEAVADLSKRAT